MGWSKTDRGALTVVTPVDQKLVNEIHGLGKMIQQYEALFELGDPK